MANIIDPTLEILQGDTPKKLIQRTTNLVSSTLHFSKKDSGFDKPLLPFYNEKVDRYFQPMWPGESGVIIAQTSNGKTWQLRRWLNDHSNYLKANTPENYFAVYVALGEDTIESLGLNLLYKHNPRANVFSPDFKDTEYKDFVRSVDYTNRIIYIAPSMNDFISGNLLTAKGVINILHHIQESGNYYFPDKKIMVCGVFLDYLQSTADGDYSNEQPFLKVKRETLEVFAGAKILKTQIIAGAQSVDILRADKHWYVPGVYEVSNGRQFVAQKLDVVMCQALPIKKYPNKTVVEIEDATGAMRYTVHPNTMQFVLAKRRGSSGRPSPAGMKWILDMDFCNQSFHNARLFERNPQPTIAEMEATMGISSRPVISEPTEEHINKAYSGYDSRHRDDEPLASDGKPAIKPFVPPHDWPDEAIEQFREVDRKRVQDQIDDEPFI